MSIRVRLSTQHPDFPLHLQTPGGSGRWGEFEFITGGCEECDFWVICDGVLERERCYCSPDRTILITWEPPSLRRYNQSFVRQFAHVISCHDFDHPGLFRSQEAQPWYISKDYDFLKGVEEIQKSKLLGIVTSGRRFTPLQKQREALCERLVRALPGEVVLSGQGVGAHISKWDALHSCRYSLAIENTVCEDYLTEKLPDCLLAGCFAFYYGCPNVSKYFTEDAYEKIDLNHLDQTVETMISRMKDPQHYDQRRGAIYRARKKYLDELSFFPLICGFLQSLQQRPFRSASILEIRPESECGVNRVKGWVKRLSKGFQ